MEESDSDLLNKLHAHCYRKQGIPLVYIATYKCASTYYTTLLLDTGWDRIPFTNIDWGKDRVFGFINDPDLRLYKGFVEDVGNLAAYDPEKSEELESHILKTFKDFNQHLIAFSLHTVPISIKLGKLVDKIDWIPIFDDFPHHQVFLKLLKEYGLTAEPGENLDPHMANDYKKQHYEKFKSVINSEIELYKIFTLGNRDLFNQVRSKINPNGASWQEISWLKDKTPV